MDIIGRVFVIIGTFSVKKRVLEDAIIQNGGIVRKTLNEKTDYLLAGTNSGGRIAQARRLGIPVLTEKELREVLKC